MPINQITTSNTFQQWLIATQGLISTANTLTDGNGQTFIANTILEVSGTGATFVVKNTATINVISANTITTGNLTVTSNIATANITNSLKVGGDATVSGNAIVYGNANIVGDLTVTGNLSLDTIGFDDLSVSGSGSFGNTLSVVGQTTLSNLNVTNIIVSSNIARANITTSLEVGTTANILGSVYIAGDLTIGGNTILDSVGFDDLTVSGSATIANNATISGNLTVSGNTNLNTANINVITGNAVNQFDSLGISVVMAIALG
jgi:hypothetical protein